MGQYFKLVNTTKKEFVVIDTLGENNKFGFLGYGLNGIVLSRLLCSAGDDESYGSMEFIGRWAGDNITIAGYNEVEKPDDKYGEINLYFRTNIDIEYRDISDLIIIELTKDSKTLELLNERAIFDKDLKAKLSKISN